MAICIFFGNSNGQFEPYRQHLKDILIGLIENHQVNKFYIGHRGDFDKFAHSVISELRLHYPHIERVLVLAYHPKPRQPIHKELGFDSSVYLIETPYPTRFAITQTNKLCANLSDYVIAGDIFYSYGSSSKIIDYAIRRGKKIFYLKS